MKRLLLAVAIVASSSPALVAVADEGCEVIRDASGDVLLVGGVHAVAAIGRAELLIEAAVPRTAGQEVASRVAADARAASPATVVGVQGSDIRSVRMLAPRSILRAEITVASLLARAPGEAERWEVRWEDPWRDEASDDQMLRVERDDEGIRGWAIAAGRQEPARAWLDLRRGIIRVDAPRATFGFPDATRLARLRASSLAVRAGVPEERDVTEEAAWVVGPGCSTQETPVCPVVADPRGDARPAGVDRDAPPSRDALDVIGIAIAPEHDEVVVSVRFAGAEPPAEVERAGVTVSWRARGEHWFVQAERGASGIAVRSGRAHGRGPWFGGARARGTLHGDVVTMRVARARVGAPVDGTPWDDVSAVSWTMPTAAGRGAAAYHAVDVTAARRYLTGARCSF